MTSAPRDAASAPCSPTDDTAAVSSCCLRASSSSAAWWASGWEWRTWSFRSRSASPSEWRSPPSRSPGRCGSWRGVRSRSQRARGSAPPPGRPASTSTAARAAAGPPPARHPVVGDRRLARAGVSVVRGVVPRHPRDRRDPGRPAGPAMVRVANEAGIAPTRISFVNALSMISHSWMVWSMTPLAPGRIPSWAADLGRQLSRLLLPERRPERSAS